MVENNIPKPSKETIEEVSVPPETNVDDHAGNKAKEFDLATYGAMPVTIGGGKPTFDKLTKMIVIKASLMMGEELTQAKKDGTMDTFRPVHLNVEYSYDDGKKAFENYGGGKMYLSATDPSKNKFWVGDSSALGKLIQRISDTFDYQGRISEIPSLVQGKTVTVMTEKVTVNGKTYAKNIIQSFYL